MDKEYIELIYLINRLQTNEESPHNIIKNHFLKEDGEEFEPRMDAKEREGGGEEIGYERGERVEGLKVAG